MTQNIAATNMWTRCLRVRLRNTPNGHQTESSSTSCNAQATRRAPSCSTLDHNQWSRSGKPLAVPNQCARRRSSEVRSHSTNSVNSARVQRMVRVRIRCR